MCGKGLKRHIDEITQRTFFCQTLSFILCEHRGAGIKEENTQQTKSRQSWRNL